MSPVPYIVERDFVEIIIPEYHIRNAGLLSFSDVMRRGVVLSDWCCSSKFGEGAKTSGGSDEDTCGELHDVWMWRSVSEE